MSAIVVQNSLGPSSRIRVSPCQVLLKPVQQFGHENVTDRDTFKYIILEICNGSIGKITPQLCHFDKKRATAEEIKKNICRKDGTYYVRKHIKR